jgi:anthranilate synthase component 2
MIDNYDSFTYNLVQYFGELDIEVKVFHNDMITLDEIKKLNPKHIVISPGPCNPKKAGISIAVIKTFAGKIPLLGVCLGHQCIAEAFGGNIVNAKIIMHGKTSAIHHLQHGVFKNLPNKYQATRYHSLVIEQNSLSNCFEITAWTEKDGKIDEIMGIKHKSWQLEGVQFHPESILTEYGHKLLRNFLSY